MVRQECPTSRLAGNETLMAYAGTPFEKHYRVAELAQLWGLGRETVRQIVCREPDVLKIRMGRKKAEMLVK